MIQVVLKKETGEALWVDVLNPKASELQTLSKEYNVHKSLLKSGMDPLHLPKYEKRMDMHFMILRAYDDKCRPDHDSVHSMTFKLSLIFRDNLLILLHRRELPFLEELRLKYSTQSGSINLQELILEIFLAVIETYYDSLEKAEMLMHEYEKSILKNHQTTQQWGEIFHTKTRLMVLKRTLWHSLNTVQKFIPHSNSSLPLYHDVKERIENLHFFADSLLDDLNNLLHVQISLTSNGANEVMRVLTVFSCIFMPLNFIVGIYGMNFTYMPEIHFKWGYVGVWCLIVATFCATLFWFKRRGWIS